MRPQVGVAVFCWRDGKFLMQRRGRGSGEGCWSVPGGAQEHGETFEEAGIREVWEETRLKVSGLTVAGLTNDIHEGGHWVTIWLSTEHAEGEPVVTDECTEFRWSTLSDLPSPLWQPFWENIRSGGYLEVRASRKDPEEQAHVPVLPV